MVNYPIGDFFIRIKNAALARKQEFVVPYSKTKEEIARVLVKEGYLKSAAKDKNGQLVVGLAYIGKKPQVTEVKIISKPGLHVYKNAKELKKERNVLGVKIVATSRGVMTDKEAMKKGVGGEVLTDIY